MRYLLQISNGNKANQMDYDLGNFIADNIFLIVGLIVGIIVAVVMRKNLKAKP
ncbi:hypothetical protein [Christiangramia sp.]|uniref:hypothetical protein n=1 Tax=Christiangramia sp. TaxID=1931228 RepID=UPI00260516B8|nr:hypothetical protein [Christiangramia sp.]